MTDTSARVEQLIDVPLEMVETIVSRFQADGAIRVLREEQHDGSWIVTAEFPNEPVGKAG